MDKGMDQQEGSLAFAWLYALDQRYQGLTRFSKPTEVKAQWTGILFRLGQHLLLTSMQEVSEVLRPLPMTVLPRVKPWLLGVANNRGKLLPVIDLPLFLLGALTELNRHSGILVVEDEGNELGFLVTEVLSIRKIFQDQIESPINAEARIQPYSNGMYREGDKNFNIISLNKVLRNDALLDVAA